MIRDQIKLYTKYSEIRQLCFCCDKNTHYHESCPLVHYIADQDFIIKKTNFTKPNERNKNFMRILYKSSHALSNLQKNQQMAIKINLSMSEMIFTDDENEEIVNNEDNIENKITSPLNYASTPVNNNNPTKNENLDFQSKLKRFNLQKYPSSTLLGPTEMPSVTELSCNLSVKENNEETEKKNSFGEKNNENYKKR